MPQLHTLTQVNFKIEVSDTHVVLSFFDPPSGEVYAIPFDKNGWQAFKRHVDADGDVPVIALPGNGQVPRMDIPKGK